MNDIYECLACFLEGTNAEGFTKSVLARAHKLFAGEDVFYNLFSRNDVMLGTQAHKKILSAFSRSRMLLLGRTE